jgi:hypothetical protein
VSTSEPSELIGLKGEGGTRCAQSRRHWPRRCQLRQRHFRPRAVIGPLLLGLRADRNRHSNFYEISADLSHRCVRFSHGAAHHKAVLTRVERGLVSGGKSDHVVGLRTLGSIRIRLTEDADDLVEMLLDIRRSFPKGAL